MNNRSFHNLNLLDNRKILDPIVDVSFIYLFIYLTYTMLNVIFLKKAYQAIIEK